MRSKDTIYLDYAANTPVENEVLVAFNEATIKYMQIQIQHISWEY